MALPRYAVLQSCHTNKYLKVENNGDFCGHISFNGDDFHSPFSKIEFVKSNSEEDGYHIRSCYNNKYWIRKSISTTTIKVAAEAEELLEDAGKTAIVLTVKFVDEDKTTINLGDVGYGDQLWVNHEDGGHLTLGPSSMSDGGSISPSCNFKVISWDNYFALPTHVAFKGDNGKYLYPSNFELALVEISFQQFQANDFDDLATHYQVFPNSDGSVRIKSKRYDQFWWRSTDDDWIKATAADSETQDARWKTDCQFWPFKVGADKVALRSLGNNKYCERWPNSSDELLSASKDIISKATTMEVRELVLRREICDVDFDLKNARVYDEKVLKKQTLTSENRGSQDITDTLKFSYKETTTEMWSATVSVKLGVETTFKAGVPFIVDGEVKVSVEVTGSYTWGKVYDDSKESEIDHQVIVPSKKKITADLFATEAACDVPFSYTQRDTLFDGSVVVTHMDDGLFTGVNSFDIKVITNEEPIA